MLELGKPPAKKPAKKSARRKPAPAKASGFSLADLDYEDDPFEDNVSLEEKKEGEPPMRLASLVTIG